MEAMEHRPAADGARRAKEGETGARSGGASDLEASRLLEVFRRRTVGLLLRVAAAVALLVVAALTPMLVREGQQLPLLLGWSAVTLFALASLPRVPYAVRAWVLVMPGIAALIVVLPVRVDPVSLANATLSVVLLTLLVGPRSGVAGAVLVLAPLAGSELLSPEARAVLTPGIPLGVTEHRFAQALGIVPSLSVGIAAITLVVQGLQRGFEDSLALLREARRSDQRFRGIFEASPDPIAVVSSPGELILDVNPGFERVYGWSREEAIGRSGAELGLIRPGERALMRRRFEGRQEVDGLEVTVRSKDGALLQMQLSMRRTELGGETVVVVVGRDVTAQRRLEAAVRHAQRIEAMGQLAGGIAHNFRNALGAILPNLNYCLEEAPAHLREALEDSRSAASAAVGLAERLTRMARHDPGSRREPFAVGDLLAEVASICRGTFGSRFDIGLDVGSAGMVVGDRGELHQVFLNLLLNARDALEGHPAPAIRVTLVRSADGRSLVVAVADNGTGMDAETLQRLGEPFFTTKGEGRGTGLGLSTAYASVQAAGGGITVESRPGEGTTFRVQLPLAEAPPVTALRGAARALVVDADRVFLETVGRQLAALGVETELFDDPCAAAERLRTHAAGFALLVTDLDLPGDCGAELAAEAGRASPALPILILTGSAGADAPGAAAVLAKPVSTAELAAAVSRCLGLERPGAAGAGGGRPGIATDVPGSSGG